MTCFHNNPPSLFYLLEGKTKVVFQDQKIRKNFQLNSYERPKSFLTLSITFFFKGLG